MQKIFKQKLRSVLLLGSLVSTGAAYADPVVDAINNMNQNIGTILQTNVGDMTREQLANALINYQAAAWVQQFQYNQQLLFMAAPGSAWSLQAGAVAGGTDNAQMALNISNTALINSIGGATKAKKVTLNGQDITVTPSATGPLDYVQQFQSFIQSGDPSSLSALNPAAFLLTDNITKANPALTPDQAQQLIRGLTNVFGQIDPTIQAKIQAGQQLSGPDLESLGTQLSQYAVSGVSAAALADVIARRTPANGQPQSLMEMMDNYSAMRFGGQNSTSWLSSIGAASDTALLREIAQMMAFQIWREHETFRVLEMMETELASLNGVMSKINTGLDQMTKAIQSAASQAKLSQQQLNEIQQQADQARQQLNQNNQQNQ